MTVELHARFVALHANESPLMLPNAWDAASARLWQEAGATAVATSSAAVAWSRGYADGSALPRDALLGVLRDIVRVVSVPVTMDFEDGYSDDPKLVAELAVEVAALGAVGVNIEDGSGAPEALAEKIRAIRERLPAATPLFINARTDVYLRELATGDAAVEMTIERLRLYAQAGADGGFMPGLADADAAARIAGGISTTHSPKTHKPLALNVMAMSGLPPVATLHAAGVRRVSCGASLFKVAFSAGQDAARAFLGADLAPLSRSTVDYNALNALFASL